MYKVVFFFSIILIVNFAIAGTKFFDQDERVDFIVFYKRNSKINK
jgi:hypothetical protein